MALVSVEAIYEDGQIRLLKRHRFMAYRILITFVEPVMKEDEEERRARRIAEFQKTFGSWQDDRPVEEMLREIYETRRSKLEPPRL